MYKLISLIALSTALASCGPNVAAYSQDFDDLITREACSVTVDKSAVSANTDIDISIKLTPLSTAPKAPIIHVHPATAVPVIPVTK